MERAGIPEMDAKKLLEILSVAEKLKCSTRHCYTSNGRRESVAEHSWRTALMAMLLSGEKDFAAVDMNRVIRMCLIHDLGEAFTGDIPAFQKTEADSVTEKQLLEQWIGGFCEAQKLEFQSLFTEMEAQETKEAKLYKALDKLEALIQHNESDLSTWLPLEYELQYTYGTEQMKISPYLQKLRAEIDAWTTEKIHAGVPEQ